MAVAFYINDNGTERYISSQYLKTILLNSNEVPSILTTLSDDQQAFVDKLQFSKNIKTPEDISRAFINLFKNDDDYVNVISILTTLNKSIILAMYYIYYMGVHEENGTSKDYIKKIITSTNEKTRTELIITALNGINDEFTIDLFTNITSMMESLSANAETSKESFSNVFKNESVRTSLQNCKIPYSFHKFNPLIFYFTDKTDFKNSVLKYCRKSLFNGNWLEQVENILNESSDEKHTIFLENVFRRKISMNDFLNSYCKFKYDNDWYFNSNTYSDFELDSAYKNFKNDGGTLSYNDFCDKLVFEEKIVEYLYDFFSDIAEDTAIDYANGSNNNGIKGHWYFDVTDSDYNRYFDWAVNDAYDKIKQALSTFSTNINPETVKANIIANNNMSKLFARCAENAYEKDDIATFYKKRYNFAAFTVYEDLYAKYLAEAIERDWNERFNNNYSFVKPNVDVDYIKKSYAAHYNNLTNSDKITYHYRNYFYNETIEKPINLISYVKRFVDGSGSDTYLRSHDETHYVDGYETNSSSDGVLLANVGDLLYNGSNSGIILDSFKKKVFSRYESGIGSVNVYNYVTNQFLAENLYSYRTNYIADRNFGIKSFDYNFVIDKLNDDYKITKAHHEDTQNYYDPKTSLSSYYNGPILKDFFAVDDISFIAKDLSNGNDGSIIEIGNSLKGVLNEFITYLKEEPKINSFNLNDFELYSNGTNMQAWIQTLKGFVDKAKNKYENKHTDKKSQILSLFATNILKRYWEFLFDSNNTIENHNYFTIKNYDDTNDKTLLKLYKTIFALRHIYMNGKNVFDAVSSAMKSIKYDTNPFEDLNSCVKYFLDIINNTQYATKYLLNKYLRNRYNQRRATVKTILEELTCDVIKLEV